MGRTKKGHAPWKIVVGCCCIQGSVLGIVVNTRGLFFTPVCADLGFKLGAFTAYGMFNGLACCAAIPIAARVLERFEIRSVLSVAALILSATQFSFGLFSAEWQWYAAGAIQGIAHGFLAGLTIPLLVSNWFKEKNGVVLGITAMTSGIVGAIFNPVASHVISQYGWRVGYYVLGAVIFLMTVPATLFLIRLKPEETDAFPEQRVPQVSETGLAAKDTIGRLDFWLLIVAMGIAGLLTCYPQMLNGFGLELGLAAEGAALLVSFAMLGNLAFKLGMGALSDWTNEMTALLWGVLVLAAGYLLLISGWNGLPLYLGAFFAGLPMAIISISAPLFVVRFYGKREYGRKYSFLTMASNLGGALGITLFGCIVERSGYRVSQITACLMTVSIGIMVGISFLLWKKTKE